LTPAPAPSFRDRVEKGVVESLIALCRILPLRAAIRFGERLGGVIGRIDRQRRSVALANLELAYGDALTPERREAIVRGVYRHLGRFFFEYLLLLTRRELRPLSRFLEFDAAELERTRAAVREHGAAIFVTLHQGHWELLGGAVAENVTPVQAVMTPIRNPLLNRRVVALRGSLGMEVVDRENAAPTLFRRLRHGGSVALLADLNQKEKPEFADFFGVPAATVRAPGILAVRTGKPLICGTCWSLGEPLRYRAQFAPPILARPDADPDEEASRVVREMNLALESFVRVRPEEWNWIHPRWKTRPQDDAERPLA